MLTLVLLISHTIADFLLQTEKIIKQKSEFQLIGYLRHGFTHLVLLLPLLVLLKMDSLIRVIFIIGLIIIVHAAIDYIKEILQSIVQDKRNSKYFNIIIYLADQMVHIILIILISSRIEVEYSLINEYLLNNIFIKGGISNQELRYIFIVLYISLSGAYLIPLIFDCIYNKVDQYNVVLNKILKKDTPKEAHGFIDGVKTGRWIGVIERFLITIFLSLNQFSSIGFIIAVKSLARFKMMENKIFSEYYLLGTLFSVTYSIVAYIILARLI